MYFARNKIFDRREFARRVAGDGDHVALFRDTLRGARERLREFHDQGASSQDVVRHHAWLVDQLIHFAWKKHADSLDAKLRPALVAVGGYGRGELHPCSDVDLMLLLAQDDYHAVEQFTQAFLSFLWDIGLEVGHSVRSLDDCVAQAGQDITVATNIMEARVLEGDEALVETMRKRTGADEIWAPDDFYKAKLQEQFARHGKFEDTAYNLEPNIKAGPGGLRDIQTISWVVQRRYGVTDLKQLVDIEFLTPEEHRTLIRGRNFLWKLRNGLHFLSGRREDRLLFDYQRALAKKMGYEDQGSALAVEQLMKRYYRAVKELRLLNEMLLQHYDEVNAASKTAAVVVINEYFQSYNGYLETNNQTVFKDHPTAMLELFLILQKQPDLKGVRAGTIRQVRANLHRINQSFREDPRSHELFLSIMRQPVGITHTLRRMSDYGVLGAYIPVFGCVVGQMQHDLFHVYTVDAHSLFVVRNLRRLTVAKHQTEFPLASQIIGELSKPERLYLGGLFHDIAKGRGGDHSILGEKDALHFCKLHGMSEYDAHFVSWLVRHHLLMSNTAQREDIADPNVLRKFLDKVGDQEHLDNLYLLTIADIRATGPQVWNSWKGKLLEELYFAATRVLRGGAGDPIRIEDRIADIKHEALPRIDQDLTAVEKIREHWSALRDDYFLRHNAEDVAWHVNAIAATPAIDLPLVSIRKDPRWDANIFLIYAPESENLLTAVTAAFETLNLNIVEAKIHSTLSGFALYAFVALDTHASGALSIEHLPELQHKLRRQMLNPKSPGAVHKVRLSRTMKHFPIDTQVNFSDAQNSNETVMEVVAQDQPGLLHRVARCLQQCKVRLVTAKIATFGERAEDFFFITDRDAQPVTDPGQRACLTERIHAALQIDSSTESTKAAVNQ